MLHIVCYLAIALLSFTACKSPSRIELPISQELDHQPLTTFGAYPTWLDGNFLRNSAIPLYKNGKVISHEFDGLAMLHSFTFDRGTVFYTNRFLRTEQYNQVMYEGSSEYKGFATGTVASPNSDQYVRNASVNVFRYPQAYVALTEIPPPARFNIESLETLGNFVFQDDLPKLGWESAHPHYDASAKEIINYLIEFGPKSYYVLYRMKEDVPTREIIAKLPVDKPSYMHSFAVTSNYIILTEFGLVVSPRDLLKHDKPFIHNFEWHPELGLRIHVVDKATGAILLTTQTDTRFSFHHANAYEDATGAIIMDLVAYPDIASLASIFPQGKGITSHAAWKTRLERYTLDLKQGTVTSSVLLEQDLEFPRCDDSLDGSYYRYLYMTSNGGLVKFDHETKTPLYWKVDGYEACEPVFVAAPDAESEDGGILLTVINSKSEGKSYLVALDATSMTEIARSSLPWAIPASFHGQYFE